MLRVLLALAFLLVLPGCDVAAEDDDRVTGQQRVVIDGYELYGVDAIEESDGRLEFRVSDVVTDVFRFGALPRLVVDEPCRDDVDVCATLVVNRPTDVEVTLDREVTAGGELLPAGTDLAGFLSTPDRDALLDIPPDLPETPDPEVFVAFDNGAVQIPDGEVRVSVRWTTNDPDVVYTAGLTVEFIR